MKKQELIQAVWARNGNLRRTQIASVVESVFSIIESAVAQGEKVTILGFGTFEPRLRDDHRVINPQTGEPMIVKAKKYPAFRAGSGFKAKVAE